MDAAGSEKSPSGSSMQREAHVELGETCRARDWVAKHRARASRDRAGNMFAGAEARREGSRDDGEMEKGRRVYKRLKAVTQP